jgi:hypothetical protein
MHAQSCWDKVQGGLIAGRQCRVFWLLSGSGWAILKGCQVPITDSMGALCWVPPDSYQLGLAA